MEVKLLTIKEYAKLKHVSYEAVRKQLQKYKDGELKDHIIRQNKTQLLDEYAVDFLDNRRRESPVILYQESKDEEIEALREERQRLLEELNAAKNRIIAQQDRLYELASSEQKMLLLEATSKAAEEKATRAEEAAKTAEERVAQAEEAAKTAEDIAQCAAQEAERAKAETAELQKKLESLKKRGLWARIWNREE